MTEELTEEVEAAVRNEVDEEEIRDTDIAFDCPQCGKNLVIDYRGAGSTVRRAARRSSCQFPTAWSSMTSTWIPGRS